MTQQPRLQAPIVNGVNSAAAASQESLALSAAVVTPWVLQKQPPQEVAEKQSTKTKQAGAAATEMPSTRRKPLIRSYTTVLVLVVVLLGLAGLGAGLALHFTRKG